jgi:hypothetical protein
MSEIWTPPSHRFSGLSEARKAAQDYDSNLDFGFNNKTGQWCIYLRRGTMAASAEQEVPILGFNHIPGRDEVQKRLYQTDALRRGHEILDEINKHNDELLAGEDDGSSGELAEVLEWANRKEGQTRHSRVFMPGDK